MNDTNENKIRGEIHAEKQQAKGNENQKLGTVGKFVYDKFFCTMGVVKEFWESGLSFNAVTKKAPFSKEKFYCRSSEDRPWFGSVTTWMEEFLRDADPKWTTYVPVNISDEDKRRKAVIELEYLLPEKEEVKQFLPIFLTAYLINRRENNLIVNSLYEYAECSESLDEKLRIFRPSHYQHTYKFDGKSISVENNQRVRAPYLKTIIFLKILSETSDICNVAMCYYAFEAMTGYISLLGNRAYSYVKTFNSKKEKDLVDRDRKQDEQIVQFINELYSEAKEVILPRKEKEGISACFSYPMSYLIFIKNLKHSMSKTKDKGANKVTGGKRGHHSVLKSQQEALVWAKIADNGFLYHDKVQDITTSMLELINNENVDIP